MFWIALPLTLGYMGLCGYMYARQRDLVYHPQETRVGAEQTDFALANDGVTLRGWIVNPGRKRALVYFGGNSEPVQVHRAQFARWFPRHTVYLVAYRGFGASDGQPSEDNLVSDALVLFDHVRVRHPGFGVDVIGYSLGSGVAAHVAAKRRVRRLALITPYDTLADIGQVHYRWLPMRWLARERYDSIANLSRRTGPTLIVRAGRDAVIPAANTQRLIDALPRRPRVLELPCAEHGSVATARGFAGTLKRFFAAHTPRGAGASRTIRPAPAPPRPTPPRKST